MKLILRILFLSLLASVTAACAATSSTIPAAQPEATAVPTQPNSYVPSDVSLVANTGRPQFLDSYADW
jgi:uncharacterized lipoprotein YajG